MSTFVMPSLGADMEAGTLVEWLKKPGDPVARGDIVAVVETQKGAIEIEIFDQGVIDRILVEPGQKVPVGTPLARVRGEGEPAAAPTTAPAPPPEVTPAEVAPETAPTPPAPPPAPQPAAPPQPAAAPTAAPAAARPLPRMPEGARPRVTPAARRRAAALGLDPASARATGPDGAITLADVERLAAAGPEAAAAVPPPPRRGGFDPAAMRQAIGAAMARSKREIPHYYLSTTIDLARPLAWLERANRDRPVAGRLLQGVLLLKATALALRKAPALNGFWRDGRFEPSAAIHVGWAISLRGGGLVAPAVHDADGKSLDELMADLRDLVQRARAGGLRSSEMTDPTITVTSLGEQGTESVLGVIYPPQVALVGFGRVVERPWVVDGRIAPRPLVAATLAADHRASDGHLGGLFLAAIDRLLQEPDEL